MRKETFTCVDCSVTSTYNYTKGPLRTICQKCRHARDLAAGRRWIEQNGDRKKAATKEWRKANPERLAETKAKYRERNRIVLAQRQREWNAAHPDKVKAMNLKGGYGLTLEGFLQMYERQSGQCAICQISMRTRANQKDACCVDHDHVTGKVRGLLCSSCNMGIGQLGDSAERLRAAASYLDRGGA